MIDGASLLPSRLRDPDHEAQAAVRTRAAEVLRPTGALERLDRLAVWLAGWQRRPSPRVDSVGCLVFVADHGVAAAGVSAYPPAVTEAMLRALRQGVATASAMCADLGAELNVVDVGTGRPTADIRVEAALSADRFTQCWEAGRDAVSALGQPDLIVLGEMGIGNTTVAAALCAALFGGSAEQWTGAGTGVNGEALERKRAAVDAARLRVAGVSDPLELLRQVGGSELVALAAAVVEARARSLPVLLDGFVVSAASAPLELARPGLLDHTMAAHCSAEPGHRLLLARLGMDPLLDLGMRLGEASGALAAVPLVRMAARCVTDVATFQEWGLRR